MNEGKEAETPATDAKSPDTNKSFQERFNETLEGWRKIGCDKFVAGHRRCGAPPHRVKMEQKDAETSVMLADCVNGHTAVWAFEVPTAELQQDLERQQDAAKRAHEAALLGLDAGAAEELRAWAELRAEDSLSEEENRIGKSILALLAQKRAEALTPPAAAKDPMKASLKISMDLKTQQVEIDPWVPNPGLGIQLAGMLLAHFFAEQQANIAAQPSGGLKLPEKRLIDPKTGKPIVFS